MSHRVEMNRIGFFMSITPLFVGDAVEFRFGVADAVAALVSIVLVRVVQTVVVSVAEVQARDAVAVVARKQVAETRFRHRFTIFLRLISTCHTIIVYELFEIHQNQLTF